MEDPNQLNQFNMMQNCNQQMFQNMNQNQIMFNNNNQFNMMPNMNQNQLMLNNNNQFNIMPNFNQQMFQNMNQNPIMLNDNINQFNMMPNLANMNNMNLMLQNQMIERMANQMNNPGINLNIPPNQVHLIDSIIQFYKKNNNEYMNYNNPIQIKNILNLLNPNYTGLKYNNINQVEDPLYYIKGPKIIIKFINSDYIIYKVRIPKTINKYDLHTIAKLYKYNKGSYADVLLIYNNNILNNDESSIEFISEEDEFRIIEPRNYPDDSYYNYLNKKIGNKMNIFIFFPTGKVINFILPENTFISEMIKALNLKFGLENKYTSLSYNAENLASYKDRTIKDIIHDKDRVYLNEITNPPYTIGKTVMIDISYTEKNIEGWIFDIGLLNSVNLIIKKVESFHNRKVKKIILEGKELTRNEEKCLLEYGIKNNFNCLVEFEKK